MIAKFVIKAVTGDFFGIFVANATAGKKVNSAF